MRPSSASISRTRWPWPRPAIAGLHDMAPMVAKRCVTKAVIAPMRAAAAAASQPAWPPPTTSTSNLASIRSLLRKRALYSRQPLGSKHASTSFGPAPFHVKHRSTSASHRLGRPLALGLRLSRPWSLANAEIPKDHVQNILDPHAPRQSFERPRRQPDLLSHQFLAALQPQPQCA